MRDRRVPPLLARRVAAARGGRAGAAQHLGLGRAAGWRGGLLRTHDLIVDVYGVVARPKVGDGEPAAHTRADLVAERRDPQHLQLREPVAARRHRPQAGLVTPLQRHQRGESRLAAQLLERRRAPADEREREGDGGVIPRARPAKDEGERPRLGRSAARVHRRTQRLKPRLWQRWEGSRSGGSMGARRAGGRPRARHPRASPREQVRSVQRQRASIELRPDARVCASTACAGLASGAPPPCAPPRYAPPLQTKKAPPTKSAAVGRAAARLAEAVVGMTIAGAAATPGGARVGTGAARSAPPALAGPAAERAAAAAAATSWLGCAAEGGVAAAPSEASTLGGAEAGRDCDEGSEGSATGGPRGFRSRCAAASGSWVGGS